MESQSVLLILDNVAVSLIENRKNLILMAEFHRKLLDLVTWTVDIKNTNLQCPQMK